MSPLTTLTTSAAAFFLGAITFAAPTPQLDTIATENALICAEQFLSNGEPSRAADLLDTGADPAASQRGRYYYTLARALHEMGAKNEAGDVLEKALWATPDYAPAVALMETYRNYGPQAK